MQVDHVRHVVAGHSFQYRIPTFGIDLDDLASLNRLWPLFGVSRWSIFSLWPEEYLHGRRGGIRERLSAALLEQGLPSPERVVLVTLPRYLGYVFNPVSFFVCFGPHGVPTGAIAEVNNTFGETTEYCLHGTGSFPIVSKASKQFYVSPFFDIAGEYTFTVREVGEGLSISIALARGKEPQIEAHMAGAGELLSWRTLGITLLKYPAALLFTMARIEWQALVLYYRKRVAVFQKPVGETPPLTRMNPGRWDRLRALIISGWARRHP